MLKLMRRAAIRSLVCAFAFFLLAGVASSPGLNAAERGAPKIHTKLSALPEPVKKMRERILEAARSGNINAMHPIVEMNELKPTVSFGGANDPVAYWKQVSGDGQGREIMAIMIEILQMPFVHTAAGTSNEIYVWPYLSMLPPEKLTPSQQVDLYRLISPDEAKTMKEFGSYIHYRLGIGPDGTWHFFVAGD